jgi:uncharacterized pyridoxamine 5'-phosphate oxidase family protein
VYETDADVAELQRMFDTHLAHAGPHMTAIVSPKRRLSARQVVRYLTGIKHVAFATVTAGGEPRVSPLDTLFIRGRFTLSSGSGAVRLRHLRANPACSAVYMEADKIAVVANGVMEWIGRDHVDHDEIHGTWQEAYESDPYDWGDGIVFFRIQPASMWAYAFHPEDFPE